MDYAEAIRLLHPDTTRDAIWEIEDKQEAIKKIEEACVVACEAMKELALYKDGKLCLIPESVLSKQCEELDEYKSIGSIDEVREAVEKQHPKTPTWDGDGYAPDGTFVWDEWKCPRCGTRYEVDYDEYDYCPNCGQHIDLHTDWSDEEDD